MGGTPEPEAESGAAAERKGRSAGRESRALWIVGCERRVRRREERWCEVVVAGVEVRRRGVGSSRMRRVRGVDVVEEVVEVVLFCCC